MTATRQWLGIVAIVFVAALGIALTVGTPDPGGPDDGLLHLAGATALLRGGEYPIVQRPPLYSAVLTLLASLQGVDTISAQPLAQELGSILFLDVLTDLLGDSFFRLVQIVNLVFWALTALLVALTLRAVAIPWRGVYLAVLLMLTPSSWRAVGLVSETPLAAFVLALGLYALVRAETTDGSGKFMLLAGTAFALAALTRATYQLLVPALVVPLILILRRQHPSGRIALQLVALLLPFVLIVGGWSLYNQRTHGVLGVSGVGGVALSTHTAYLVERAATTYPDESVFVNLRDETYLTEPDKQNVVYWGARAANWLMKERGLTYVQANRLLLAYNLAAIRAGPLTYLDSVFTALVGFHYPGADERWPALARLSWSAVEFAIIGAFVIGTLLWLAAHVLARFGLFASRWRPVDTALSLALAVYAYTALVVSAIDVGKPEQRFPVHFILPLVIVLAAQLKGLRTDTEGLA